MLQQLGVGDGAVGIENFEQGETALPVALFYGLQRGTRRRQDGLTQQVELLQNKVGAAIIDGARLTGEYATDKADASGTLLFDVRARAWSPGPGKRRYSSRYQRCSWASSPLTGLTSGKGVPTPAGVIQVPCSPAAVRVNARRYSVDTLEIIV